MARVPVIPSPAPSDFLDNPSHAGVETLAQRVVIERNRTRVFDVRDYGAVGDGVADDTQAWIDAGEAASAGQGTVLIPNGITGPFQMLINNPVPIFTGVVYRATARRQATLSGSFPGATIQFQNDDAPGLEAVHSPAQSDRPEIGHSTIEDLGFLGAGGTNPAHNCIEARAGIVNTSTIQRCHFARFGGFAVYATRTIGQGDNVSGLETFSMRDSFIIGCVGGGLYAEGLSNLTLDNVIHHDGGLTGVGPIFHGVVPDGGGGAPLGGGHQNIVTLVGCKLHGAGITSPPIVVDDWNGSVVLVGNTFGTGEADPKTVVHHRRFLSGAPTPKVTGMGNRYLSAGVGNRYEFFVVDDGDPNRRVALANNNQSDLFWPAPSLPSFTTAQRDALPSGPLINGMQIYNSSTHKFQGRANGTWVDLH